MIAAVPNIMGWLAISFAKVWRYVCQFIFTHCFTNDNIGFDGCSALQDTSFLYMGRLLEGFGVGVISYVVCIIKLHAWLCLESMSTCAF